MLIEKLRLQGVLQITPEKHGDDRGWFIESYSQERLLSQGIDVVFVQDNHSYSSKRGILRGIHYQRPPKAQSKLVRCTRGSILDVAVDLRKGSPSFGKWISVELSAENMKQIFIPKGFGHGFITLTDDVEVQYKVDELYSKKHDASIRFNDDQLNIDWGIKKPVLSKKDNAAPLLKDVDTGFSVKVLVTGVKGQLGHDVVNQLKSLGINCLGVDVDEFDITEIDQTNAFIDNYKPDVVIHCAAYTAVDRAEEDRETCFAVNATGAKNIALACRKNNSAMVYVSTDYVFDGSGCLPHQVDEKTNPINYYGYSKEVGEKEVRSILKRYFIIRTSWLYGINGSNFVKTMLKLSEKNKSVKVVSDQFGAPTYSNDLAEFICSIIQTENYGTYHGVNEGYCSWYEFACEIFNLTDSQITVIPVSSDEFPVRATRPKNSRLDTNLLEKKGFSLFQHWKDAVRRYLAQQNLEKN